jgi:hypothetical protein
MARATAREIEYHYFEQFRKHFALPNGGVDYADKPDVRLSGSRYIGIEIARLYISDGRDPASEQVQAGKRKQVLARAQALHAARGGRQIELYVDFDPAQPIVDVPLSASRLASLARELEAQEAKLVGDLSGSAEGVRFVYHSGVEYTHPEWRTVQVFNVHPLSPARLQAVVSAKTKKAAEYAACDEYWLLLVVDFMDPAQDQELVLPSDFRLEPNAFQRVFLYKPQFGQVVEVPQ